MLHSIECKPFRESTDTPTFCVIKPAANEVLSEWHSFQLSIAVDILHDIGYIRSYIAKLLFLAALNRWPHPLENCLA